MMDRESRQDGPNAQAIAADDVLKASALRRVKLAATALLAFCGLLFLAKRRQQFGRPIAGFQLVQDLLVRMLGNITATQSMMLRLSQLQDQGLLNLNSAVGSDRRS